MGDNMSKRLKLVTASESEMEERSFVNPYTDWDQGVFTSSNSGEDSDGSEPFDTNGKVIHNQLRHFIQFIIPLQTANNCATLC